MIHVGKIYMIRDMYRKYMKMKPKTHISGILIEFNYSIV